MYRQRSRREQHIAEAAQFTREVGGTDCDVKRWFLSRRPAELRQIMQAYGRRYGSLRREYAEQAYDAWRTGRRRMSGMVAKRLFSLLPPFMNAQDRLGLIESLWKHYAPKRSATAIYGPSTLPDQVGAAVRHYFDQHATGHSIPTQFTRRFKWLAKADSTVYQELLNKYLELDRDRAARAATEVARVIQQHVGEGSAIQRLTQTVKVDGLAIAIECHPSVTDISITAGRPSSGGHGGPRGASAANRTSSARNATPTHSNNGWIIVLLGIALVIILIAASGG